MIDSADPPGYARTGVKGFAAVPILPDTLDPEEFPLPDDTRDALRTWTIGPTR